MTYVVAVPVWKRRDGQQVYQVFFKYVGDGWESPLCHEFMTSTGSSDVSA